MGFKPMIPVFQRVNTVNALGRAATVIGSISINVCKMAYNLHFLVASYLTAPFTDVDFVGEHISFVQQQELSVE
jgi:hypothetical protein